MIGERLSYSWTINLLADYGEEVQMVFATCLCWIILAYEDQDTFNRKQVDEECWQFVHKNVPYFTLDDGEPMLDYDFIGRYEILQRAVTDLLLWTLDEYRDEISVFHNSMNIEDVYCLNMHRNLVNLKIVGT